MHLSVPLSLSLVVFSRDSDCFFLNFFMPHSIVFAQISLNVLEFAMYNEMAMVFDFGRIVLY